MGAVGYGQRGWRVDASIFNIVYATIIAPGSNNVHDTLNSDVFETRGFYRNNQ